MQMYDDRLTFLLPRPVWVNDTDVSYCSACNAVFSPLKRRHHCRNCGTIFCHDCSSRNVPLPQLGYGTKPVRVCNNCFDVAYLVTYCIDEDHGLSTQMHGVRGLLQLAEKDDENDLHNMIAYGGVDALIWLCKSSKNISLHHIATTILSILTEKESIRPVIITKWALPPILYLIHNYTQPDSKEDEKQSPTTSIKSGTTTLSHQSSLDNTVEGKQNIILEITINCTHILYQLSRAGILSQKEVISDGILNTLLKLAVFNVSPAANDKRSMDTNEEQQCQHMIERLNIINSLAIKSISAICSLGSFQDSIIKIIQSTNTMPSLLRSSNSEVQKYMAKSFAYLSLRNEKYKAHLVKGEGARALISIIAVLPHQDPENETEDARLEELSYYFSKCIKLDSNEYKKEGSECLNSATVSHACCALANLATNNESQMCLMSQPHFLRHLCNVPAVFSNAEIHRHVARCLANLTLYENNIDKMLADKEKDDIHSFNVLPTLLAMGQSARVTSDIQRQLVRAIDNLSSHVFKSVEDEVGYRVGLFEETFLYIQRILDDESDKDADTVKRARNIMEREVTVVVEKVDEQSPKTKRNKKKSKGKTVSDE